MTQCHTAMAQRPAARTSTPATAHAGPTSRPSTRPRHPARSTSRRRRDHGRGRQRRPVDLVALHRPARRLLTVPPGGLDQPFTVVVEVPADAASGHYGVDVNVIADESTAGDQAPTTHGQAPALERQRERDAAERRRGITTSSSRTSRPRGSRSSGSATAAPPLASPPTASTPVGSVPVGSIPVGSIPVGSIPVGSIPWARSPSARSRSARSRSARSASSTCRSARSGLSSLLLSQLPLCGDVPQPGRTPTSAGPTARPGRRSSQARASRASR